MKSSEEWDDGEGESKASLESNGGSRKSVSERGMKFDGHFKVTRCYNTTVSSVIVSHDSATVGVTGK